MNISGTTRVYGLVGHPVAHSRSPALYNPWFQEAGIDARYVCFDVEPSRGEAVLPALDVLGVAGANLTIPFKQIVVDALDEVVGLGNVLQTVNTIVRTERGWVGHNTDGVGFIHGLQHVVGDAWRGQRAVILGAGGAGLGVGAALAEQGFDHVAWLNRNQTRARAAADLVAAAFPECTTDALPLDAKTFASAVGQATVVVNALSGPGAAVVAGFDPTAVHRSTVWCDLNYWMDAPPLRDALCATGVQFVDGAPMLRFQAVEAFRLFTGSRPPGDRSGSRIV